jgi:glycosyltransferase involved in cell wall biosynthesis
MTRGLGLTLASTVSGASAKGQGQGMVLEGHELSAASCTQSTQFHTICFEGPDAYSRAGGIASRITGLNRALAADGFATHLWFVGDPRLPADELTDGVHLHRWCQWISEHHPGGVYQGEEEKRRDYVSSLPPVVFASIASFLRGGGGRSVVFAEEWHTADAVLHLDWLLRGAGLRDRVMIFWNANNVFGFDRIDWGRLARAAIVTTVSRYMCHKMWDRGVNPIVLPNGIPPEAFLPPDRRAVGELRRRLQGRLSLAKVARWDPDKRWFLAVDTAAELKRLGWKPLLIARGGMEAHGGEVLARAHGAGLRIADRSAPTATPQGLLDSLSDLERVDLVNLRTPLTGEMSRILFRSVDSVLANSAHEPFGLVGLEAMAAGGLACTGHTGEDYAVPGWNALVLQTDEPAEFVRQFARLRDQPREAQSMRRRGMQSARRYEWREVIWRNIFPHLGAALAQPAARLPASEPSGLVLSAA